MSARDTAGPFRTFYALGVAAAPVVAIVAPGRASGSGGAPTSGV